MADSEEAPPPAEVSETPTEAPAEEAPAADAPAEPAAESAPTAEVCPPALY